MKKSKIILALLTAACLIAPAALGGCEGDLQSLFSSCAPTEQETPAPHAHTLQLVTSDETSCTGNAKIEYWHCDGCGKNFADEEGKTLIADMDSFSSGHLTVIVGDGSEHYRKCVYCEQKIGETEPHGGGSWIKTESEHYRVCSVCGEEYGRGEHVMEDNACATCDYFTDYSARCASDYGYDYLRSLSKGEKYAALYDGLDEKANAFHSSAADAKQVEVKTSSGTKVKLYALDEVNYSSLGLTTEEALCVWSAYRDDHPLYYWISNTSVYTGETLSPCVDNSYARGSARAKANETVYSAIGEYMSAAYGETSAYRISLALHDKIIDDIDYCRDSSGAPSTAFWAHCVIGVFEKKAAVCDGYAKAFQLLLNACGVENAYVTGRGNDERHAWNMVKLDDGNWYWVDVTWDDQPNVGRGVIYDYFCAEGKNFVSHTVNAAGDFSSSQNFQYALPEAATEKFDAQNSGYGETFVSGNFSYRICGYNKVALTGAINPDGVEAITQLPEQVVYGGRTYALAEIDSEAFNGNEKLTDLFIPKTVTLINNFAFRKCKNLVSVTLAKTSGWQRYKQDGTAVKRENIQTSELINPTDAATLIKYCYGKGGTIYQYVWVNSDSGE